MITVEAIFKGKDGSMGYNKKQKYTLTFWSGGTQIFIKRKELDSSNPHGFGKCPYDSLSKFLDNWEVIK